jgi:hypothetical protein
MTSIKTISYGTLDGCAPLFCGFEAFCWMFAAGKAVIFAERATAVLTLVPARVAVIFTEFAETFPQSGSREMHSSPPGAICAVFMPLAKTARMHESLAERAVLTGALPVFIAHMGLMAEKEEPLNPYSMDAPERPMAGNAQGRATMRAMRMRRPDIGYIMHGKINKGGSQRSRSALNAMREWPASVLIM